MHDEEIHDAVRVLRKEVKRWPEPIVGLVAKETSDPFKVLISCILSLRTKDHTTAQASRRLFALAQDPTTMGRVSQEQLEKVIYPVGFYRTKANQIRKICHKILDVYGGKVPRTIDELMTLEGVGRKTANLVVTVRFNKPGICVDVHVHRICNRWGYIATSNPEKTEEVLRGKLPRRYWITFNDLLVPFGQNICRPISPHCSQCKIIGFCERVGVKSSR
jgi:endonuclease-3